MKLIQIALIATSIAALVIYLRYFRSKARDRLLAVVLVVCQLILVINPDLTVVLANFVGVGRGTDLVLYILVMASTFFFILLYARILKNEQSLTEIVRAMAIANPKFPAREEK